MKLRLQAKYALMMGGVALSVSCVLTALFLYLAQDTTENIHQSSVAASSNSLMRELEARGQGVVSMLVSSLIDPLYFEDFADLSGLASACLSLSDVRTVKIYDARGQLIQDGARHLSEAGPLAPPLVLKRVIAARDWVIETGTGTTSVTGPVLLGNEVLGAATVVLNHQRLEAEIAAQHMTLNALVQKSFSKLIRSAIAILPFVLLCTALAGIIAARRMTLPIERLREATAQIAAGQFEIDWPSKQSSGRNDELGELADDLKKMILQLKTKTVSMAYLDDIIGSMFDCLVVIDSRQCIEKVNTATCRLTGYAPLELINQPFAKLLAPPPRTAAEIAADAEDTDKDETASREGVMFDTVYAKSGAAIAVEMGSAIMASHVDGKPRTVTVFRDVSDQRAREQELRQAKDEAEVANASKSQFLANMSHELRTPLNAIIGFSSMIKEELKGPLNPTYKSYALDIHDSAYHLLAIINDILDISKLEAGKMELYEEAVALDEILPSVLRIVRHRADQRQITITVNVAANFPDLLVDQRMLKQIFINLASNAVKFNITGGTIGIAAYLDQGGQPTLIVSDTGIGMKAEDLPHLLEPFAQADAALNRTYQGTGLGLAITKSMIELHGGIMTVESAVGIGTSISISLPTARAIRSRIASATPL